MHFVQVCTISQYEVWDMHHADADSLDVVPNVESGRRLLQSPSTVTLLGGMDIHLLLEPGKCAPYANYGVHASIMFGARENSA